MRMYSIVVFGFDIDNEYFHDCDFIKAKDIEDAFAKAIHLMWKNCNITSIDIRKMEEYNYVVVWRDNKSGYEGNTIFKADSETEAKVAFRLTAKYGDYSRYQILYVKGVKWNIYLRVIITFI